MRSGYRYVNAGVNTKMRAIAGETMRCRNENEVEAGDGHEGEDEVTREADAGYPTEKSEGTKQARGVITMHHPLCPV